MKQSLVFLSLVLIVILSIGAYIFWQKSQEKSITNFQECVDAGNPVAESYPRTCTANGQTFTEKVDENKVGLANPASVYCEENEGTLEIRENADGSQTGYCKFDDGSECEEWAYMRGECTKGLGIEETKITVYMFDLDKFDLPDNTDYLIAVSRSTDRQDVATFAIEQIISGPTDEDKEGAELDNTFGEDSFAWFTGASTCGGNDFSIDISTDKVATVKFCRTTMLAGDMSGFIIEDQIRRTLKQFPTIEKVEILNNQGTCFNDMSGLNQCVS